MSDIFTTRKLVSRDGKRVEVRMFAPTVNSFGVSDVVVHIDVDGEIEEFINSGRDHFQSITLALVDIWRRVEELGCKTETSPHEGEHFFSRIITYAAPLYKVARLHALIDEEEKRVDDEFNERMERRREGKQ